MFTSFVHFQLFEVSTGPHQHLNVRFYNFICYLLPQIIYVGVCMYMYVCLMFIPELHLFTRLNLGPL